MKADLGSDLSCGPGYWVVGGPDIYWSVKSLQSCPTLCDPMDCSPPGSSVHEVLQARILEWVSHVLFQGIFPHPGIKPTSLRSLHWQVASLPLVPPGKPCVSLCVCIHTHICIYVFMCVYTHTYMYMYVSVCLLTLSFVKVIFLTLIRWAFYKTDLKFLFFLTQKITDLYKE